MAITLSAKGPNDVIRYSWSPALADGDTLASYVLVESGCVIDSDSLEDNAAVFFVSGGTAGATASITATAVSGEGEEFEETLYLAIIASTAIIGATARDVCAFALRKIVGMGEDAEAEELEDALERLNDMLLSWQAQGASVDCTFPILAATELLIRDEFVQAVKYNLRVSCHEQYGEPIGVYDATMARSGLALIKNANLPEERGAQVYY